MGSRLMHSTRPDDMLLHYVHSGFVGGCVCGVNQQGHQCEAILFFVQVLVRCQRPGLSAAAFFCKLLIAIVRIVYSGRPLVRSYHSQRLPILFLLIIKERHVQTSVTCTRMTFLCYAPVCEIASSVETDAQKSSR